jgi:hypothetical protein
VLHSSRDLGDDHVEDNFNLRNFSLDGAEFKLSLHQAIVIFNLSPGKINRVFIWWI